MALGKDQFQLNSNSHVTVSTFGAFWSAQTFTPSVTGNLDRVYLDVLAVFGVPGGPLIVRIRNTTAGLPSGADLASESIPAGTFGTSIANVVINFSSPPVLISGTQYAIIISAPAAGGSKPYNWGLAHSPSSGTADYYNGGNGGQVHLSSDSGVTWPDQRTVDFSFVTEMSVVPASPSLDLHVFGSDDVSTITITDATEQVAQTFEPTVTGNLEDLVVAITKSIAGPGITIEVQTVDGFNEPSGTVLASTTVADGLIPASGSNNTVVAVSTINFSTPAFLTQGVRFAIVIKTSGAANYIVGTSGGTLQLTNSTSFFSTDTGSTWADQSKDILFGTLMNIPTEVTEDIDLDVRLLKEQLEDIAADVRFVLFIEVLKDLPLDVQFLKQSLIDIQTDVRTLKTALIDIPLNIVTVTESLNDLDTNINVVKQILADMPTDVRSVALVLDDLSLRVNMALGTILDIPLDVRTEKLITTDIGTDVRFSSVAIDPAVPPEPAGFGNFTVEINAIDVTSTVDISTLRWSQTLDSTL